MNDEREGLPSCSKLDRYHACPGSWALEKIAPPQESNPDAEMGTRVHEWLSHDGLSGKSFPVLNGEEQKIAGKCVELADQAAQEAKVWQDSEVDFFEQRFWFCLNGKRKFSGKADRVIMWGEEVSKNALIIDYKTGRGDVDPAPSNRQLQGLVACLDYEMGPFHTIYTAIVGPFQKPQVSIASYTRQDIDQARFDLIQTIVEIENPNAIRIPGDHCKYCPAKAICPELQTLATSAADSLVVTGEKPTKKAIERSARDLPNDSLVILLQRLKEREWANDAIKAEAKRRLKAGHILEGWTLSPGIERQRITDLAGLYGKVASWCPPEKFTARCSITKTAVRELVAEKFELKGEKLDETVESLLEGCTETTTTEPSLEREQ